MSKRHAKFLLLFALLAIIASTARADVLLPLQFGNRILTFTGTVGCSNALDFSQACNSQYFFVITPGIP